MANQYLDEIKNNCGDDEICETPLKWSKKKKRFYEEYPCEITLIKVR